MRTVWVDLAEICKDRVQVHGMGEKDYGISCFMCEHYWQWHGGEWVCELPGKEQQRKRLEASRCKGQKILVTP